MPGALITPKLVSRPAEDYLTEFSTRFDGAYVAADSEPWAEQLGLVVTSKFKQRIPIPVDAPSIRAASGDPVFRRLFVGHLQFEPDAYTDGIEEDSDVLEAPDFSVVAWGQAPENMAREFRRNLNTLTAALLEANGYLDVYSVRKPGGITASAIELFSASHKVNLVDSSYGTQSNVIAQGTHTDFDETLHNAVRAHFSGFKAANGQPMKLRATHVLVPTGRAPSAEKYYSRATVIEEGTAGVVEAPNIYQRAVQVVEVPEFTDADYVYYCVQGLPAYVVQTGGAPEERRNDKTSQRWRDTNLVSVSYRAVQGVAGLVPHGILRVDLKATPR